MTGIVKIHIIGNYRSPLFIKDHCRQIIY